ncbi:hypothetical protein STRATTON_147 [Erwinia phage vB_EamM_Stratton]|uniref:Uncharacterized protein n=1 Tax=Erwinia phage vB_EamM_Stratton TaxID=1883378 RepID=A0A1B2IH47_9CAUD|nr:hypothetical protein STRATTON_147 [Erwinia phage vB_EamM_Stratton]
MGFSKRGTVVFQKGHARLYKGKKLIHTFKYEENQLIINVVILGLASKWTPLDKTLAGRAMAKLRWKQRMAWRAPLPAEAFMVQPRHPHIITSAIISKIGVADLNKMITVRGETHDAG